MIVNNRSQESKNIVLFFKIMKEICLLKHDEIKMFLNVFIIIKNNKIKYII